jgi:hypothetical protein
MTSIDHIAKVIQLEGCVVMGIGVTPERYRLLLQGATNQDYIVLGPKDSADANFIASRMNGESLKPKSLSVLGLEMDIYLIRNDKRAE